VDVWTYFAQREKEIDDLSLIPRGHFHEMCGADAGTNGQRGRIVGILDLNERAYIQIHEVIVVNGNSIHREEYGYFFIVDDDEVWGFERDPSHDPAVHAHGRDHERLTSGTIAFKAAVERAWYDLADLIPEYAD
jgi:hypothetical protein